MSQNRIAAVLRRVDAALFPNRCLACRAMLPNRLWFCQSCDKKLARRPDPRIAAEGGPFVCCVAPLRYRGVGRSALLAYKFQNRHAATAFLAAETVAALEKQPLPALDCVCWTPMRYAKYRKRGYNQSCLLARRVAKSLGLPSLPLLRKTRRTETQSKLLDETARRANVDGAYRAAKGVGGKRILLIDDVWTTGATARECGWTLLEAGAAELVFASPFARD